MLIIWGASLVAAILGIAIYTSKPGVMQPAPKTFPLQSAIPFSQERPLLLAFAHPECPCTRASFYNQEDLVKACGEDLDTYFVFYLPDSKQADFQDAWLINAARRNPNIRLIEDRNGEEAKRFHVHTSGQALIYDRRGKLAFQGGVTVARGHAGESPGPHAIRSFLQDHQPQTKSAVYGCSIFNQGEHTECTQPL